MKRDSKLPIRDLADHSGHAVPGIILGLEDCRVGKLGREITLCTVSLHFKSDFQPSFAFENQNQTNYLPITLLGQSPIVVKLKPK